MESIHTHSQFFVENKVGITALIDSLLTPHDNKHYKGSQKKREKTVASTSFLNGSELPKRIVKIFSNNYYKGKYDS